MQILDIFLYACKVVYIEILLFRILHLKSVQGDIKEIEDKGHRIIDYTLYFKYGSDGSSGHSEYQHTGDSVDQNSLFTSYLAPIQVKANLENGSSIPVYVNKMHNSPMGMCPLRFKFEKETDENSKREGDRLSTEEDNLASYFDPNLGTHFNFKGMPSMVDGKVKFTWSRNTPSMNNCVVCGATVIFTKCFDIFMF